MKFMRFGLVLGFLLTPALAFAANTGFFGPVVPACSEGGNGICQACNLVQLAQNILRLMVTLSVFAASVMFAYAGFLYVTAASNHSHLDSAKKIFANTLIGLIFILCAYLIVDLTLKVFTGSPLDAWSKIQCVKATYVNGQFVSSGTTPDAPGQGGVTGTQGTPTASSTKPSPFDQGKGTSNVDSITNYSPQQCNSPQDQKTGTAAQRFQGCQWDAQGNPIRTVQDYKDCKANPGGTTGVGVPCSQVTSVTVAVPQGSGIPHSTKFTWPEMARYYGLPDDTVFTATDSYGPGRGYTTRGTYSVYVAACGKWNKNCNLPSRNNTTPFTSKPTPIPGG